jgi:ferredoxin-NADP reductase
MPVAGGGPGNCVLHLTVRSRRAVSATVTEFMLEDASGHRRPAWQPGAHLAIRVPDVGDRQFSLRGDPAVSTAYRIAVLREADGGGGSAWLHEHLRPGDTIHADPPINHLKFGPTGSYRLIAGEIGITPLLPIARELDERGPTGDSRTSIAPGGRWPTSANWPATATASLCM